MVRGAGHRRVGSVEHFSSAGSVMKCSNGRALRSARMRKIAPSKGKLLVIGAGPEPLAVSTFGLLFGEHSVGGALTGSPADSEDTLNFSLLQDIRATIETFPLAEASRACARMMNNDARFRIVLTTGA